MPFTIEWNFWCEGFYKFIRTDSPLLFAWELKKREWLKSMGCKCENGRTGGKESDNHKCLTFHLTESFPCTSLAVVFNRFLTTPCDTCFQYIFPSPSVSRSFCLVAFLWTLLMFLNLFVVLFAKHTSLAQPARSLSTSLSVLALPWCVCTKMSHTHAFFMGALFSILHSPSTSL